MKVLLSVILILALTASAAQRNRKWHTLLAIWQDCAEKSPDKSRTRNNLGNCNLLLGRHFPAIAEYQRAVALEPRNLEAQYNLATTLDAVGFARQAAQPYDIFCRSAPPHYEEQRIKACNRVREILAGAGSGSGGEGGR